MAPRRCTAIRHSIDVEALIRAMVFSRLCDPEFKLGVLRWMETVAMPGINAESIAHQHLSVVFYDMTTIHAERLVVPVDDRRKYGLAKEGLIIRQVMLGVVRTGDGLPIYPDVFAGNAAEPPICRRSTAGAQSCLPSLA